MVHLSLEVNYLSLALLCFLYGWYWPFTCNTTVFHAPISQHCNGLLGGEKLLSNLIGKFTTEEVFCFQKRTYYQCLATVSLVMVQKNFAMVFWLGITSVPGCVIPYIGLEWTVIVDFYLDAYFTCFHQLVRKV